MHIKRWICVACTVAVIGAAPLSGAQESAFVPSDWAAAGFAHSQKAGLIPSAVYQQDYRTPISRELFCTLIVNAYQAQTGTYIQLEQPEAFSDTRQPEVVIAYHLGLATGDPDGRFRPDDSISRQEAAVMLAKLQSLLGGKAAASEVVFVDDVSISDWAKNSVAQVAGSGLMMGLADGRFAPTENVSVEQAVVLAGRLVTAPSIETPEKMPPEPVSVVTPPEPIPADNGQQLQTKAALDGLSMTVQWNAIPGVAVYHVHVVEHRTTRHADEMGARDPIYYDVEGETAVQFQANPEKRYEITVWAEGGYTDTIEVYTPKAVSMEQKIAQIEECGEITTKEQADALMKTIEVHVWKISGGKKVASTAHITVHSAIADAVWAVFEEVFNGDEQFPIQSVGGYAWRPGDSQSEHNRGTAIDINPDQNYCIYSSGTVVGDHWSPYEDPYSIPPYGDVIEAFERHGFVWGGDAWNSTRDYMHFSYLGT